MKKEKNYVSEIDTLLSELRLELPESASQAAERLKYEAIALKRDQVIEQEVVEIWEKF